MACAAEVLLDETCGCVPRCPCPSVCRTDRICLVDEASLSLAVAHRSRLSAESALRPRSSCVERDSSSGSPHCRGLVSSSPPPPPPLPTTVHPHTLHLHCSDFPFAQLELSALEPAHARHINRQVPAPFASLPALLALVLLLEDDAVLARLSSPFVLLSTLCRVDPLAHPHGHLALCEDARLGAQLLQPQVGGQRTRAPLHKGLDPIGCRAARADGIEWVGGGKDVGLAYQALEFKVVGQEGFGVLVLWVILLPRLLFGFGIVDKLLCGGVWGPRGEVGAQFTFGHRSELGWYSRGR